MIGRWLALLTEQEEDNLLTTKLVPFTVHAKGADMGCLVGVALKQHCWGTQSTTRGALWWWWNGHWGMQLAPKNIAYRFNELCQKLVGVPKKARLSAGGFHNTASELEGGARAARLIRARILRHRAQRALRAAPTKVEEAALVAV